MPTFLDMICFKFLASESWNKNNLKIFMINSLYVKSIYYICICLTIKTYKNGKIN